MQILTLTAEKQMGKIILAIIYTKQTEPQADADGVPAGCKRAQR